MDVGVEDGDLVITQGAVLNLLDQGGGVALRLVLDGLPVVHGLLALGDDEVGHIQAGQAVVALALAHGEVLHVQIGVAVAVLHQLVDGGVDLLHGVELVIGGDLHAHGAQGLAVHGGGELVPAAHVHIGAAVGVGGTVGGGAVMVIEERFALEGDGQAHLAVHSGHAGDGLGEQRLVVLGHPAVQRAALGVVGELLGVQVAGGLVVVQGPDHLFRGGLGLVLGHVHRDGGLERAGLGQIDDVFAAVLRDVDERGVPSGLRGHGREDRQRQAQCHHGQQGNDLFPGRLLHLPHLFLVHFAVFRPEFWGGIRAYHNSIPPQGFCQGQEARAAGLRGSAGLTVFGVDAGQGLWYNISKMRIAYGERAFMEMIGTKWA